MSNNTKGFVRGVVYPLVALLAHAGLTLILSTGWLSTTGALALTGLVAWADHNATS